MISSDTAIVGVISDTHGLLRPDALAALRGSDLIIHAGDVGERSILDVLRQVAPVFAVRGNIDKQKWARTLPETEVVDCRGRLLYVLHNIDELDLDPAAAGLAAVVYGHSHRPARELRRGVLYFNPGSAGPRRFSLPISLGRIIVEQEKLRTQLITLDIAESKRAGPRAR